jgi:homoserine dehydrogenase
MLMGIVGLGGLGTAGAFLMKKRRSRTEKRQARKAKVADVWARPGMSVTFRAELMPGRDASERTFRVTRVLPSGRVTLDEVAGEHMEKEFQALR